MGYLPTFQPAQPGMLPPGSSMTDLMQLLKLQAPQSPIGGAQFGGGQLPGMPPSLPGAPTGTGAPPSPQMNQTDARDRITNTLMQSAGNQLGKSGTPGGSLVNGALDGMSLVGQATGKSPLTALKNMMAPSGGGPFLHPEAMSDPALASAMTQINGAPGGLDAYLGAMGPGGAEQLFSAAPAVEAGMSGLPEATASLSAAGELGGLGELGSLTAADLGLAGAELAPAIPAALEGGAAAAGGTEAAAAAAASGLGPVGWGGLGVAGLLALLSNGGLFD